MKNELILEVKKKREFSGLPDSIVERALVMSGALSIETRPPAQVLRASLADSVLEKSRKRDLDLKSKEVVKDARALLRKYFGVFLTNKVLKGKGVGVLESHISSRERDYEKVYGKIIGDENVIVDLGCGANGFSFEKISELGKKRYVGVEATGQLVKSTNDYFKENDFDARIVCEDLMNFEKVLDIVARENGEKAVWMFNVVDALENFEKDYSKKLIDGIFGVESVDRVVISLPVESISGRKKFNVSRLWLTDFLENKYRIVDDFLAGHERVFIVRRK